jgi:rRNA maturation endonuclease Nob1
MYEVYTLSEVIAEIKDQKTRQFVDNLPYKITIASASTLVDQKDLQVVEDFARETGDLQTLSKVDKLVIAAGISLAKQKNEFSKVKMQPADLKEFRPKAFKEYYEDPVDKCLSSDEDES